MTYSIDIATLRSKFGDEGHIVGFGGVYFTLWSYQITEVSKTHQLLLDAYYIRNIGKNNTYKDKLPYDEHLKGKVMHFEAKNFCSQDLQPQTFHTIYFSRKPELGSIISECEDENLLCWKFNNRAVDNYREDYAKIELEHIKQRAIELGALCINNYLFSKETQQKEWCHKELDFRKQIENNQPITYTFKYSIKQDGSFQLGFYTFFFDKFKYFPPTYYGSEYALPIDSKGKAKRVKGKTIRINSYQPYYKEDGTIDYFKVTDWEVVK